MASKKCPKCGEDNPAEAVMCWACYTPLSGGGAPAVAGAKGGAAVAGKVAGVAAPGEEEKKKQIDPKQLAIGGLLLVGVLVAVVMNSGMLGGGGGDDGGDTSASGGGTADPTPGPGGGGGGGSVAPPPPQIGPAPGPGVQAPVALPYSTAIGPNPRFATATIGIVATDKATTSVAARGLAKFAKDQFARNGRWQNMQIVVFTDPAAARAFATYQAKRKSERLTARDYAALASQGVWLGAPTYYQAIGKTERFYAPSQSPNGWWSAIR